MGLDQDLFQTIALALGAVGLLLLLVVLSTLGRIRKAVEEGRGAATGSGQTAQPAQVAPATSTYAEPLATTSAPVAAAAPVATAAPAAAATPAAEPQDQPFERDGRWWYRRGDELLVYDEGTGQWVPTPSGAAGAPGGGAATGFTPVGGAASTTATQPQPAAAGADVGGWKCPSCGAINGATATSCRMCFTPRA